MKTKLIILSIILSGFIAQIGSAQRLDDCFKGCRTGHISCQDHSKCFQGGDFILFGQRVFSGFGQAVGQITVIRQIELGNKKY